MVLSNFISRSIWFYYFIYLLVTIAAFFAILIYARALLKDFHLQQLEENIKYQLSNRDDVQLVASCIDLSKQFLGEIVIYSERGNVLCSSSEDTDELTALKNFTALVSNPKIWDRGVESGGSWHLAEKVQILGAKHVLSVRIPLDRVEQELDSVIYQLSFVVAAAVLGIGFIGFVLYRQITPPLTEMRQSAERYAKGDFSRSIRRYRVREIDAIALSLNKMARQLDRLDKVRRDFIANVSHELKTPITSINGFVETLIEGALDDKDNALRFLQIIKKQSDRLTDIIVDLLTLSRLEDSRTKESLILQEELLEEVITEVIEMCHHHAQQKGIEIEGYTEEGLTAVIDRSLIIQALTNLVENAVKYSNEQSLIKVTASYSGQEFIALSVDDQGPGIPKQHLSRLFERFYRVDLARSRNQGGTGLGLAIVKHIAQVHGGSVSVESELGVGSCFTIRLPRQHRDFLTQI